MSYRTIIRVLGAIPTSGWHSTASIHARVADGGHAMTKRSVERLLRNLAEEPDAPVESQGGESQGQAKEWRWRRHHPLLIAKRASDLLDCYLGGTEKQIAAAFDQEGAILLIDEADSFLIDRRRAQRSWEVSQVNELLAQMEDYDGLLVMTTNLFDNLDPAVFRRFDLKVKFDYLNQDQRCGLLRAFAEQIPLISSPLAQQAAEARLARLDRLTPGDYALVARQALICGTMTIAEFTASLAAEQAHKGASESCSVGVV